jgi:hypothetical protein
MIVGTLLIEYKPVKKWPLEIRTQPAPHPAGFVEMIYQDVLNLKDANEADYNFYRFQLELPNIIKAQIGAAVERAVHFGNNLEADFKISNVRMGITQAGLTGPVLSLLTKKFKIMSSTATPFEYEISLCDALWSGSLTEVPKLVDKILATDISMLAPFITAARLNDIKNTVIKYMLGLI